KVLVGDVRYGDAVAFAASRCPSAVVRIAIGGDIDGFERYDDVIAHEDGADIGDPVLGRTMLYTSGTTGRPKGVERPPLNQRQDTSVARALARANAFNPESDAHLCTGPLYHAAPLAFSLLGPLAYGITVVVMDGWAPEDTLRLVAEHRVTHTHMVP